MTRPRIVAVGAPNFRRDVAVALEISAEAVSWVQDAGEARLILEDPNGRPDVLIVSPDMENQAALDLAEHVSSTSPTTAMVLVRHRSVNGLLPTFIRAGVRDLVEVERGPQELKEALGRAVSWSQKLRDESRPIPEARGHGMLITVFSSKGGTGKSFLSSNLGAAIAQMGHDTAVVDIDVAMGDLLSFYGAEAKRPLQDIIQLGARVDKDTLTSLGVNVADHLWAFGSPTDVSAHEIVGSAILNSLGGFKSTFPYTIVDVPGSYDEGVLAALDVSDFVCLIAGLDVVGIKHLAKAIETLLQIGVRRERLMIVLNRADSKVGLNAEDVERLLNIKIDALIPSSRAVPASLNKGRPVVFDDPKSAVAQSIQQFARKLAAVPAAPGQSITSSRKKRFSLGRS